MRLCLSECPELVASYACLQSTCHGFLCSLQTLYQNAADGLPGDQLLAQKGVTLQDTANALKNANLHRMAIVGLDLLVSHSDHNSYDNNIDKSYVAFLLEANCNPALPQPSKHRMTPLYYKHVKTLCKNLMEFGLGGGKEPEKYNFSSI